MWTEAPHPCMRPLSERSTTACRSSALILCLSVATSAPRCDVIEISSGKAPSRDQAQLLLPLPPSVAVRVFQESTPTGIGVTAEEGGVHPSFFCSPTRKLIGAGLLILCSVGPEAQLLASSSVACGKVACGKGLMLWLPVPRARRLHEAKCAPQAGADSAVGGRLGVAGLTFTATGNACQC
jgi:hypothetical protein